MNEDLCEAPVLAIAPALMLVAPHGIYAHSYSSNDLVLCLSLPKCLGTRTTMISPIPAAGRLVQSPLLEQAVSPGKQIRKLKAYQVSENVLSIRDIRESYG